MHPILLSLAIVRDIVSRLARAPAESGQSKLRECTQRKHEPETYLEGRVILYSAPDVYTLRIALDVSVGY